MPGVRTSMRKIREVLRLRERGLTVAEIARSPRHRRRHRVDICDAVEGGGSDVAAAAGHG